MLCHLGLPTVGPQLGEKCVCLLGGGSWQTVGYAFLAKYSRELTPDLQDNFILPLIFPSFSSLSSLFQYPAS